MAFRVVAANQQPDHATIARFRAGHETAIAGLFGQVLVVCARAGLLKPGLVAIDGTKLTANASRDANLTVAQIADQLAANILTEAAAVDAVDDSAEAARKASVDTGDSGDDGEGSDSVNLLRSLGGRRARLRALLEELQAEAGQKSFESHMARRAQAEQATGRPIRGRRPSPTAATHKSRDQANLTDPDSRLLKTKYGYVQGYNAQAVATEQQFVVAAEVTNCAHDAPSYTPMVTAAKRNLRAAMPVLAHKWWSGCPVPASDPQGGDVLVTGDGCENLSVMLAGARRRRVANAPPGLTGRRSHRRRGPSGCPDGPVRGTD